MATVGVKALTADTHHSRCFLLRWRFVVGVAVTRCRHRSTAAWLTVGDASSPRRSFSHRLTLTHPHHTSTAQLLTLAHLMLRASGTNAITLTQSNTHPWSLYIIASYILLMRDIMPNLEVCRSTVWISMRMTYAHRCSTLFSEINPFHCVAICKFHSCTFKYWHYSFAAMFVDRPLVASVNINCVNDHLTIITTNNSFFFKFSALGTSLPPPHSSTLHYSFQLRVYLRYAMFLDYQLKNRLELLPSLYIVYFPISYLSECLSDPAHSALCEHIPSHWSLPTYINSSSLLLYSFQCFTVIQHRVWMKQDSS